MLLRGVYRVTAVKTVIDADLDEQALDLCGPYDRDHVEVDVSIDEAS